MTDNDGLYLCIVDYSTVHEWAVLEKYGDGYYLFGEGVDRHHKGDDMSSFVLWSKKLEDTAEFVAPPKRTHNVDSSSDMYSSGSAVLHIWTIKQ